MCSLYSIYKCIQSYSAKGIIINNVALNKKIKFVCVFFVKEVIGTVP